MNAGNLSRVPDERPLFDRSQPYGIVFYPLYSVPEAAQILAWSPDKVRDIFRDARAGEVFQIPSGRYRPHRRSYITIKIPYDTLVQFLVNNRVMP